MQNIDKKELKNKIDNHKKFHLIEVLPPSEFKDYHLPGAVNIPLKSINFQHDIETEVPEKDEEIVVYCSNTKCDASATAANRIETMGYTNVYRFEAGKEGWKSSGYPVEH